MRTRLGAVAGLAIAMVCAFAISGHATATSAKQAASVEQSCDYSCLTGMMDRYLKALVAHDPEQIPVAEHVRFTENTISLKLGDALWGTISGMGTYKLYFADPHDGQVGFEGTIRENGTPAILLARLKVAGGRSPRSKRSSTGTRTKPRHSKNSGSPIPCGFSPSRRRRKCRARRC